MRNGKTKLHIVGNTVPVFKACRPAEPEAALRRLLRREARLEADLRAIRAELSRQRERFRGKHFLLMLPSWDVIRRQFGR